MELTGPTTISLSELQVSLDISVKPSLFLLIQRPSKVFYLSFQVDVLNLPPLQWELTVSLLNLSRQDLFLTDAKPFYLHTTLLSQPDQYHLGKDMLQTLNFSYTFSFPTTLILQTQLSYVTAYPFPFLPPSSTLQSETPPILPVPPIPLQC